MNRDDVMRMAQEAGIVVTGEAVWKLCELVAAAEREACAKEISSEINDEIEDEAYCILVALLARIRARGQG